MRSWVVFPEQSEDLPIQMEEFLTRWDDGFWSRVLRSRFSWQRFIEWWVARRWVEPRDIRKS